MAQTQALSASVSQQPRKWLAETLKAADEAAKVPLPWHRGQKRAALRARLRASVDDTAQG